MRAHEPAFLRNADPELALCAARPALGAGRGRAADRSHRLQPASQLAGIADPQAEEGQGQGRAGGPLRRGGRGRGRAGIQPDRGHQRHPLGRRKLARAARKPVERHFRHGAPATPLAHPCVRQPAPVLLPGRGGGDGGLDDGGGTAHLGAGSPLLGASGGGQPRLQPRADPARAQARDRRGQDHGDGDADRLADGECRASPRLQAVHQGVSDRRAGHHDQGPAARPPAQRSGQLLPVARDRAGGHGRRARPGQDRHHQLPRVQAQGRGAAGQGAGSGARRQGEAGDRRRAGPARCGRADGDEERRRPQRRGAPLLS